MADHNAKWDDGDDDWGKPLSDDPADVAARETGYKQMLSSTQKLLRWSYVVLIILVAVIIWLAVR